MLFKKDVEEIKQIINKFDQKLDSVSSEIDSLKEMQSLFSRELAAQREFVEKEDGVNQKFLDLDSTCKEFEKSIRRFDDLQKRLEIFVFDNLGNAIRESVKTVTKDVDKYKSMSVHVNSGIDYLKMLSREIEKFKTIAAHLKEKDFSLQEYAQELTRNDQEKLRLMKEIDNLQRLVSSLRRKQRL